MFPRAPLEPLHLAATSALFLAGYTVYRLASNQRHAFHTQPHLPSVASECRACLIHQFLLQNFHFNLKQVQFNYKNVQFNLNQVQVAMILKLFLIKLDFFF